AVKALGVGDAIVIALVAGGDYGPTDLYVVRPGAEPQQVAQNGLLVAAEGGRVAFLAGTQDPRGGGDLLRGRRGGSGRRHVGGGAVGPRGCGWRVTAPGPIGTRAGTETSAGPSSRDPARPPPPPPWRRVSPWRRRTA